MEFAFLKTKTEWSLSALSGIPKPNPCFLDQQLKYKVVKGNQIWISSDGKRLYTWDSLHGEIEVYNKHGYHLGSLDAKNGVLIKDAVKGREIDVK